MATRRAAMVAGVVLLGVLAGWLLVLLLPDDDGSSASGGADSAGAAAPAGSDPPGSAGTDGTADQTTGSGERDPGDGDPPDQTEESDAAQDATSGPPKGGRVVEHRPADAEETTAPQPGEPGFRLPRPDGDRPPAHLVDQAPEAERATGEVVAGYPVAYLRVPQRAEVRASEVSSEGTRVQAVLEATCDCSVSDVVAFHDKTLARLGMTGKAAAATGGSTARSYTDSNDRVTLTVARDGDTTTYTLFSVITAARA